MTEVQLEVARSAYRRLKNAQARVDHIARYPASNEAIEDGAGPPAEMIERHRSDYETWARAELAKADAEFAAL